MGKSKRSGFAQEITLNKKRKKMVTSEIQILLSQHTFIRNRLLQLLKEIEDSGKEKDALHFQIAMGTSKRAHIGWQMLHIAATFDRYTHFRIQEKDVLDPKLIENYGFGSKPDPNLLTSSEEIRAKLSQMTTLYYDFFSKLNLDTLDVPPHPRFDRTYKDILFLMNWHEAEHMGQCQLIWNTFKAL